MLEEGHPQEALTVLNRALCLRPGLVTALHHRGRALLALNRFDEALALFDEVLRRVPNHVDALYRKGNALLRSKRAAQALQSYDQALLLKPDFVDAHFNRGLALQGLKRTVEAIQSYDNALRWQPSDAEALNSRGNALFELKELKAALGSYEKALRLRPRFADALYNRALVLQELKKPAKAAAGYAHLLEVDPDYAYAKGRLMHARMLSCDWTQFDQLRQELEDGIKAGRPCVDPFGYLAISNSPAHLLRGAQAYASRYSVPGHVPVQQGRKVGDPDGKIRIGYMSGELRQQATSVLMAELFETHDRTQFKIYALDNGWDDASELRRRVMAAFDERVDISKLGDHDAAIEIERCGIDILVDLSGYFGFCRPGILALKPAPIQVNYLGFPGTLGSDLVDYILADRHVIPPEDQGFYSEKVVYLPDSYQVNDSKRSVAVPVHARAQWGLPECGFVFCCFNNNFKITPQIFDIWMRLLQQVPRSVLWLLEDNASVYENLRKEAESRGVVPDRLIFAPRLPLHEHLSRHLLADLFLDTRPCNAHTTASDALWAGLPLLTCPGATFASRVAASLLNAVGLPELIARDLYPSGSLALAFARPLVPRVRRCDRPPGPCPRRTPRAPSA